jgi:hypothetical protein
MEEDSASPRKKGGTSLIDYGRKEGTYETRGREGFVERLRFIFSHVIVGP